MPRRVLFSVRPFRGHVHPLIPLARAFVRRGHQVVVATNEDVAGIIAGAGLTWIPAGINPDELFELHPRADPDYGYHVVRAKVDDLLECAYASFRPDVIIRDPTDLAPIVAGEVVGAVNVIYGLARFIPKTSWKLLKADRTITRLRRDFRLTPDPDLRSMFGDLYLSVLPPSMEVWRRLPVPAVQQMRYVPWDGVLGPAPLLPARTRPRILMTLGTVYNTESEVFARFFEAVADLDIDVICTLGHGSEPDVSELAPANVRFERYVPHSQLLPCCDLMLCHGGFNTVMGSLVAGVPLVCVPLGSDQDFNARFCEERGYGRSLDDDEATPERIRGAVEEVLRIASFKTRVGEFRDAMAKRPALDVAVRRIEKMTTERARRCGSGGGHPAPERQRPPV